MKTWWLKLYTFPDIKDQCLLALICCLVHIGLHFYFPDYELLSILTFTGVLILPSMPKKSGFGNHLSFHEMSVPRKELRNAFMSDFAIHLLCKFLITLICISVFIMFHTKEAFYSFEEDGRSILASYIYHIPLAISMLFVFRYFNLDSSIKPSRSEQRIALFQHFGFFAFGTLFVSIVNSLSGSHLLALLLLSLASSIGFGLLMYREMFHEVESISLTDFKKIYKYFGIGSLTGVFILIFSNFIFYNLEFKNKNISAEDRAEEFVFWGHFSPQLTNEDFILVVRELPFQDAVYYKAPKGFEKIPLTEIFPDRKLSLISAYLHRVKPSDSNLLWLAELLEHNKYSDNPYLGDIKKNVLKKWPNGLKQPDYISELFKLNEDQSRSIASEKRLSRKFRILDRY